MTLFDDFTRTDPSPARDGESSFEFMNRVRQPFWERIRDELDTWFADYPVDDADDLRARFRSSAPDQHFAAWWELYLHRFFRRLGFDVDLHPALPGITTKPDFRVTAGDTSILVEAATTFSGIVDEDRNGAREAWITSAINSTSDPNFFVGIDFEQVGLERPRVREITKPLLAFLDGLDPDQVSTLDHDDLPELRLTPRDWDIRITPIPIKPEARGDPSHRLLGMGAPIAGMVNDVEMLGRTLDRKRKRYGTPDEPFVIAVLVMSSFADDDDILKALLGRTVVQFSVGDFEMARLARVPDGLWTSKTGPTNRHVSAVITGTALQPWNLATSAPTTWLNPWAARPLDVPMMTRLADITTAGAVTFRDPSRPPHEVFGLPADWPGPEAPFADE